MKCEAEPRERLAVASQSISREFADMAAKTAGLLTYSGLSRLPGFNSQWRKVTSCCLLCKQCLYERRKLQQRVLSGIFTPFPFDA